MTSEKIKACPFCGGKARAVYTKWGYYPYWYVTCESNEQCYGIVDEQDEQGGSVVEFKTKKEAIVAWNRRQPEGLNEEELERIIEKTWCSLMGSLTTNSDRFKAVAKAILSALRRGELRKEEGCLGQIT